MGRSAVIIVSIALGLGCSSIIEDFDQLPGDGPSTAPTQTEDASPQDDAGVSHAPDIDPDTDTSKS